MFTGLASTPIANWYSAETEKKIGGVHDLAIEEDIINNVEQNPSTSTRQLANQSGISRWKVS